MQENSTETDSAISIPVPPAKRLGELKKRLSVHIKKILDDNKAQNQQFQKQTQQIKSKTYTNLQQVQRMNDVKSQTGFFHEYELGKKLGEGCHSSVYKCNSKKQNKTFAVKVTKQKDLQLFQTIRESYWILKNLQHQNVIRAKNLFINQKYMTCHLVLQYCEWENLNVYLKKKQGKLQNTQIADILRELLKTVAYLHSAGVCHRDLKPDNILYNEKKRKIKVIDFQIARRQKYANQKLEMMTKTGFLSYRAPQMFHSIYDQRIDIWAIGVIAFELLSRRLPFQCQYENDEIRKILNEQPDYSEFSVWQQDLLQKLLCKNPDKRATVSQALSSPFFLVNSKVTDHPSSKSPNMIKSPSLGQQEFQLSLKIENGPNKFYDDDVANMFLGGSTKGDNGVIRWSSSQESDQEDK